MSETMSSAQNSASTADSAKAERLRLSLVSGGIVCALVVAVLILRFHRLNEIPQGLPNDAGLDGVLALQVLQGKHAVFFPVDQGREASAIYAIALSTALLGRTLLAIHLPTALGSAGMVFVIFWLGRLLFGRDESGRATPWRGLLIAGVGAGLLAASLSQTVIGRSAYNKVTHMPLLLSLCLALLWRGWQERSLWRIALAGVCAGLLPYTYIPARFTPFLFLLLWFELSAALSLCHQGKNAGGTAVGRHFPGCGRAGGCAAFLSILLCIPNIFLCVAMRSRSSIPIVVRENHWERSWLMCGRTCWPLVFAATRDWLQQLRRLNLCWSHGKHSFSGLAWVWLCGAGNGGPPIVCCFSGWGYCSCLQCWPEMLAPPTSCA